MSLRTVSSTGWFCVGKDSIDSGKSLVFSSESKVGLTAGLNPPSSSLGFALAGLREDGVGGQYVLSLEDPSFGERLPFLGAFFIDEASGVG